KNMQDKDVAEMLTQYFSDRVDRRVFSYLCSDYDKDGEIKNWAYNLGEVSEDEFYEMIGSLIRFAPLQRDNPNYDEYSRRGAKFLPILNKSLMDVIKEIPEFSTATEATAPKVASSEVGELHIAIYQQKSKDLMTFQLSPVNKSDPDYTKKLARIWDFANAEAKKIEEAFQDDNISNVRVAAFKDIGVSVTLICDYPYNATRGKYIRGDVISDNIAAMIGIDWNNWQQASSAVETEEEGIIRSNLARLGPGKARSKLIQLQQELSSNKENQEKVRTELIIEGYLDPKMKEGGSSPVGTDTSLRPVSIPDEKMGGIDFKHQAMASATTYEAMGSFAGLDFSLPKLSSQALLSFNLDKEQADISRAIDNGIIVSGQRIKEFMAASSAKGQLEQRRETVITWLAKLGVLEETTCCTQESRPEYREALVIAEFS
ncbi:MAG: hypothetical protein PHP10_05695, partial [Candidatus Omnitrophica bacterium]|nr:hypothetical protein [Candidatus Omnitrophota bacterium]